MCHPRPLLRRDEWWSLDGDWDFAVDDASAWSHPDDVAFDARIRVPFAPETPASGVHRTDYFSSCWYRRTVRLPEGIAPGDRVLLHFGAVDHAATVWIDGAMVVEHEGGYSPFSVDITRALADGADHELVLRAEDDPLDLAKPRGKQDWELEPHSIWYHRTSGIWQSVWLERVPQTSIGTLQWHTERDRTEVAADITLDGPVAGDLRLNIRLAVGGRRLVDDTVGIMASRFSRAWRLDASGLDELRDALSWTPENPTIIDAELELVDGGGTVVDRVHSYTAIRTIEVRDGHFVLNGRPVFLRLVLDQGYWPDTGLTPPDDDALRRDVELAKELGFNGVRKHQKIEDPRYLHWADRLGLMVWYECPPAYRFDPQAIRRLTNEWTAAIERDRSHPCVIAWVPFNESSGLLNLADRKDQQDFVRGLTLLTKALDPTRPVVSNDGWETVGGDVIGVHDYEQFPECLAAKWSGDLRNQLLGYGNHGRLQTLDEDERSLGPAGRPSRPLVLTEFGGIGWAPDAPVDQSADSEHEGDRLSQPASWGYSTVHSPDELAARYQALVAAVHSIDGLAGFCYTQFADTYQEVNGLLCADRTPKVPLDLIATATRGSGKSFLDPLAP